VLPSIATSGKLCSSKSKASALNTSETYLQVLHKNRYQRETRAAAIAEMSRQRVCSPEPCSVEEGNTGCDFSVLTSLLRAIVLSHSAEDLYADFPSYG